VITLKENTTPSKWEETQLQKSSINMLLFIKFWNLFEQVVIKMDDKNSHWNTESWIELWIKYWRLQKQTYHSKYTQGREIQPIFQGYRILLKQYTTETSNLLYHHSYTRTFYIDNFDKVKMLQQICVQLVPIVCKWAK